MTAARGLPRLHLVTDDRVVGAERFLAEATELLQSGGEMLALHLRSPRASGRRLWELASALVPIAADSGSVLLVNDRVDVALASGAAGVQIGCRGLAVADVRRLIGPERVLSASAHSTEEAADAFAAGADLVLAGTLFPSMSHPGRQGSGVEWLRTVPVPAGARLIGIGGVSAERVGLVVGAGAHGVAVITAVWDAERPRLALLRLIDILYGRDPIV